MQKTKKITSRIKKAATSSIKRVPRYVLLCIAILLMVVAVVLWLVRDSGATNNLELVRSYPTTPLEPSTFNEPRGMTRDSQENLYVVDSGNARIQKFDSTGSYISEFGVRGTGNGALNRPLDIAIGGDGNIYVTNSYGPNNTSWEVVKYTSGGAWIETWQGQSDINQIYAMIAVDSSNHVYVFDGNNYKVYKYNSSGSALLDWELQKPEGWGCSGCNGGIAVDSSDRIYVGNSIGSQNRVDRFDSEGNFLDTVVEGYYTGDLVISSDNELLVSSSTQINRFDLDGNLLAQFGGYAGNQPANGLFTGVTAGIEVVDDRVWVADPDVRSSRLQSFTLTGTFQSVLGGLGDGQLMHPANLTFDSTGHLVVLDSNMRAQSFDTASGMFQTKLGSYGVGDGEIYDPVGVATDSSGNWYVAGYSRVQKFDSSGAFVTKWGSSGSGDGQFSSMQAIISDASGNVYVADGNNHRIQKFDSSGTFITKWATNNNPTDLEFDQDGNIVVSFRYGGVLQKFNTNGGLVSTTNLGINANSQVLGFALSSQGYIYTIEKYYCCGEEYNIGYLAMYSGSGSKWGQWGTQGAGDLQFNFGHGNADIAIGGNGNLFVADTGNNRVQEFVHEYELTMDSTTLEDGEVGDEYSDAVEYSGARDDLSFSIIDGSLPPGLTLNSDSGDITGNPSQVGDFTFEVQAQDSQHSDTQEFTITIHEAAILPDVSTIDADGVGPSGAALSGATSPRGVTARGFEYGATDSYGTQVTDETPFDLKSLPGQWGTYGSAEGQISNALGMDIDADGNIYVADSVNDRISKFDSDGNYLLSWGTEGDGNGQFRQPQGVIVGSDDFIYTSEITNNRIQKFDSNGNYVSQWSIAVTSPAYATATWGLAMDSNQNIYVATNIKDAPGLFEDTHSVIQKYDTNGNLLLQWGSEGGGNGQFRFSSSFPAIAIDSADDIYVLDVGNHRVQKFNSDGSFILSIGGDGPGYNGRGSEDGQFEGPYDFALDSQDSLYVTDSSLDRVQKFNSAGAFVDQWSRSDLFPDLLAGYKSLLIATGKNDNITIHIPNLSGSGGLVFRKYARSIEATISSLSCGVTYHYRAFATNEAGTAYGEDETFTTDACPQVAITTQSLAGGRVAEAYSDTVTTEGGGGVQNFIVSEGELPSGLSLNSLNGEISGTPNQVGTFVFSITVTDEYSTDLQEYEITIEALEDPLVITTLSLEDGEVGEQYQAVINTENELSPKLYILISGSLPPGLIHHSQTGEITGTPTQEGSFTFTMRVLDDYSEDQREYTINIMPEQDTNTPDPGISITTDSLPSGVAGEQYAQTIQVQDSVGDVTYSITDGQLPDGLSVSQSGTVSGVPTNPGLFEFTMQVADSNGSDTKVLQIEILPATEEPVDPGEPEEAQMYILTQSLPDATVGRLYERSIRVRDSEGDVTFEIVSGSLPEGLQLSSDGRILGTPTTLQTNYFTIRATDDNGFDQEEYTLRVVREPGAIVHNPDGSVNIEKSTDKQAAKEEVFVKELNEIAEHSEVLSKPIAVVARGLNITPKQVVYSLPWAVVGAFSLFVTSSSSQSLRQVRQYRASRKREEFYQELIEEKKTFVSLASHYLRTPATVIKGGVELAGKTAENLRSVASKLTDKVNAIINRIDGGDTHA